MSLIDTDTKRAVVVRAAEAEVLSGDYGRIALLADADAPGGAMTANRSTTRQGDGT